MAEETSALPMEGLYMNSPEAVTTATFPVNPDTDPSRMAIGQERDAIEHPGKESFDGEIARFLIWEAPLNDKQLAAAMQLLSTEYLKAE